MNDRDRLVLDAIKRAPLTGYVFAELPRCERCGSADVVAVRGKVDQGDGSVLRHSRCRACDHRFKIIYE